MARMKELDIALGGRVLRNKTLTGVYNTLEDGEGITVDELGFPPDISPNSVHVALRCRLKRGDITGQYSVRKDEQGQLWVIRNPRQQARPRPLQDALISLVKEKDEAVKESAKAEKARKAPSGPVQKPKRKANAEAGDALNLLSQVKGKAKPKPKAAKPPAKSAKATPKPASKSKPKARK